MRAKKQNHIENRFRSLVRMHEALSDAVLRDVSADRDRDMLVRLAADVILASRKGESFPQFGLR